LDHDYDALATDLKQLLSLMVEPLAISFSQRSPEGVPAFADPIPEPVDGRTGRVSAGCVFWTRASDRTFTTEAADHANCSVGSLTHGFTSLEDAATGTDVAALLESGWVSEQAFAGLPAVSGSPAAVTYGPLRETPVDPDVVLLRLNGKQLMAVHGACPEMRIEGKPQCHIIPLAKEQGVVAASVGCMLSRARTGMPAHEMTCAIPGREISTVVERIRAARAADETVAAYAAADAQRFN